LGQGGGPCPIAFGAPPRISVLLFLKKKKQKDFIRPQRHRRRLPANKRFLVLFSKKNMLPSLSAHIDVPPAPWY
jgi:hypothetical protein